MKHFFQTFFFLSWGFSFLLGGIGALLIPCSSTWRHVLSALVSNPSPYWIGFGVFLLLLGLTIGAVPFLFKPRKTLVLRSSAHTISVDQGVLEGYLQKILKNIFPKITISFSILLRKNEVAIAIELPSLPETEREILIDKIQSEMESILRETIMVNKEVEWSFSYEEEQQEEEAPCENPFVSSPL